MFIKSLIEDATALIHKGKSYPVINDIADVPQEVRDEVTSLPHWQDATDAIDDETLKALQTSQEEETPGKKKTVSKK